MSESVRVAVTGAAGRIGYALLFRIAAGAMFGTDRRVSLSLLEVPEMLPILEATIMELEDCDFPLLHSVRSTADAAEAFADADWVLLLGSAPYRTGMARADALRANGPIFLEQGRAINESAKTARVLVVANPCNPNAMIARTAARDVPPEHWFTMTRLDQNRARAMIARKADVPVEQVTRVTAWGNHSCQVYADFHNAWIGDRPAPDVIDDHEWVRGVFEPGVAERGTLLHEIRGASPAASAAQAILGTIRSLTTPTPYGHWFSAGVVSDGSYEIPRGLVFSVPIRTEDGVNWSVVQTHYLDQHAQQRIAANVAELECDAAVVIEFMAGRTL